jgi:hypothetical protein
MRFIKKPSYSLNGSGETCYIDGRFHTFHTFFPKDFPVRDPHFVGDDAVDFGAQSFANTFFPEL